MRAPSCSSKAIATSAARRNTTARSANAARWPLREALAKTGVDPMRVRTISYGKDKPVDPGHDEAAWAKNRRGDFVLLPSQERGLMARRVRCFTRWPRSPRPFLL